MTGRTIAHYRIIEKLGAGGMGEVFKAEGDKAGALDAYLKVPATSPKSRNAERKLQDLRR